MGGTAVPTGIQAAQGQPQTGGGSVPPGNKFIGFDQYLAANQGAAQATGQALNAAVGERGARALGDMNDAGMRFGRAALTGMGGTYQSASTPGMGLNIPGSAGTGVSRGISTTGGNSSITPATPGRTATTYGTPITYEQAVALGNTTYTGPRTLDEFAPRLRGQVDTAQSYATQLGTDAGRRGLLMEGLGRQAGGAYGQSAAAFDEALATGSGSNRQRFEDTSKMYGRLNEFLGQRGAQAAEIAKTASERTAKEARKFKEQVGTFDAAKAADAKADTAAGDRIKKTFAKDPNVMQAMEAFHQQNGRWPSGPEQTAIRRRLKGF